MLPKLEKNRYLITAALPYANGSKHIGHLAGAYIPADIYCRYLRLRGKEVVFVCGSDEHGTAISNQALKENTTPKQIVDKYHQLIKDCFQQFQISFDIYHRTSEALHHETAQEIFSQLYEKGIFEEKTTEQYFDKKQQKFLADRYIKGTCPRCQFPNAYGDQCESCGSTLSPSELINPISTLSNEKPVLKSTKHWFLPLNKYEDWLKDWILTEHKKDWKDNVYGQCKSWIDSGLKPRAVTRDLDWGIPVPLPDAEGKVLYVWFDAPIGYISATKQWALDHRKNWEDFWKNKDTQLIHFIGKDNIVFHCIIFPVILKESEGYIIPENVPANEFLNLEGDKMSTSRGWSIEMEEYLQNCPNKIDELRFVLTSILPENGDSEFTWHDYKAKVNNELVAIIGNFVNRVWTLMFKYFEGKIEFESDVWELNDNDLKEKIASEQANYHKALCKYRFKEGLQSLINLARTGNKYLTDKEPWKIIKENPKLAKEVLLNSVFIIKEMAVYMYPFMPLCAQKLFSMLNQNDENLLFEKTLSIKNGDSLNQAALLFDKIEDEFVEKQLEILKNKAQKMTPEKEEERTNNISFADFEKIEMRVGKILQASKVEKADRLLHFKIDIGTEVRDIVSGIAEFYQPEELVDKKVIVLSNLEERKIRGIVSKGMLLTSETEDKKVRLLLADENSEIGSKIS